MQISVARLQATIRGDDRDAVRLSRDGVSTTPCCKLQPSLGLAHETEQRLASNAMIQLNAALCIQARFDVGNELRWAGRPVGI